MNFLDKVLVNQRVCPKPMIWNQIWILLDTKSDEYVEKPLILGAWHFTSDKEKKSRFLNHLAIASELGILDEVIDLVGDSETNWHHENE